MKRLLQKIEKMFAAAAFAEAGEFETAKEILAASRGAGRNDPVGVRHRSVPDQARYQH